MPHVRTAAPHWKPLLGLLNGGLDQACEAAFGATTAWVSDIDPGACKILAHRYPDVPNIGDITKVDWSKLEPVDILTGGYPCQPFSAAGHRRGADDERHLWPFVVEGLSAVRPKFGVFENVRGHLSLGFDQVLGDLAILGYDTRWCVMRAADVGAPHGRARIFILATDRHVRRRPDRRGGLYRHSGNGGFVPGQAQDRHDGQGPASPTEDAAGVRRDTWSGPQGSGPGSRVARVAADRQSGDGGDRVHPPLAGGESGASAYRLAVSGDGGFLAPASEWPSDVDRLDEAQCRGVSNEDSGGEPHGSGSCTCAAPAGHAAGDSSLGIVVGGRGRPVRAGGVRGSLPDVGPDGGGTDVRDPDGFVYDADLVIVATDITQHLGLASSTQPGRRSLQDGNEGSFGDLADTSSQPGSIGHGDDVRTRRAAIGRGAAAGGGVAPDADGLGREWSGGSRDGRTGSADGDIASANTDRNGQQGVGRVVTIGRDADGRSSADGTGCAVELEARTLAADADSARLEGRAAHAERGGERTAWSSGLAVRWGDYEPAIRRWESVLGRVAPAPTETSPRGAQRLSPRFVEWMMGLPEGHVTNVPDLGRNAQLKALGNGVVPQQAFAAITQMLSATEAAA